MELAFLLLFLCYCLVVLCFLITRVYMTPRYTNLTTPTTPHHSTPTTPQHTTPHHSTPHRITPHHSTPHHTTPQQWYLDKNSKLRRDDFCVGSRRKSVLLFDCYELSPSTVWTYLQVAVVVDVLLWWLLLCCGGCCCGCAVMVVVELWLLLCC